MTIPNFDDLDAALAVRSFKPNRGVAGCGVFRRQAQGSAGAQGQLTAMQIVVVGQSERFVQFEAHALERLALPRLER